MSTTDHFAIECADGISITLYVSADLPAERWCQLRQLIDRLPATVRVLRVQLVGDGRGDLPSTLGELVRHWREAYDHPRLNLAIYEATSQA
jgi:hypothetical protein